MIRGICILIFGCLALTLHPSVATARRPGSGSTFRPVPAQRHRSSGRARHDQADTGAQRVNGFQSSVCSGTVVPAVIDRVVVRRQGDDNIHSYRIPGLTTSARGTLLAVFDIRHADSTDLPGNIDVGLMRSADDGRTWSPLQ
ncbi:MAG: hypothetical protein ACKOEO_02360, partial [Planctomycetaceae bacterium]